MTTTNYLWVEKYRPSTIDTYVWINPIQEQQVRGWIQNKEIPHLLLSGKPGTGKTTLAKILCYELGVSKSDILFVNASHETGVDNLRDKITMFCKTGALGETDYRIVILDEADYLSHNAQATLRGMLEQYSNTTRFMLTCNQLRKIIPALRSRCQGFTFNNFDQTEFTARMAEILITEQIEFELDILDTFVKLTYPDLRKAINTAQQYSQSGVLEIPPVGQDFENSEWMIAAIELFTTGKIRQAREMLCKTLAIDEFEEAYKFLYRNLDFWGDDEDTQDQALIIIKEGMVNHSLCADAEINLSATIVKLDRMRRGL